MVRAEVAGEWGGGLSVLGGGHDPWEPAALESISKPSCLTVLAKSSVAMEPASSHPHSITSLADTSNIRSGPKESQKQPGQRPAAPASPRHFLTGSASRIGAPGGESEWLHFFSLLHF